MLKNLVSRIPLSSRTLKRVALAAAFVTAFGFTTVGTASDAEARGCRGYRGGYSAFYGGGGGFGPSYYNPGFYGGPRYSAGYRGFGGPAYYYGGRRGGVSFAIGF